MWADARKGHATRRDPWGKTSGPPTHLRTQRTNDLRGTGAAARGGVSRPKKTRSVAQATKDRKPNQRKADREGEREKKSRKNGELKEMSARTPRTGSQRRIAQGGAWTDYTAAQTTPFVPGLIFKKQGEKTEK